jgi:outer membrane protein assembly factor BamB
MSNARVQIQNRMFFVGFVILGSLLGPSQMNSAFAQRSTSTLPTQSVMGQFGLERAWQGQAVLNPSRDTIAHLTMDEDTVYVQSTAGVITAFGAEDGRQMWSLQLGATDQPQTPAVSNETQVLVIAGSTLYAIDRNKGKLLYRMRLPGQPSAAPTLDEIHAYIGTLDGSVYAFSLAKIESLFQEQRLPDWSLEAFVWRYKTGGQISSPPMSDGRLVTFASLDGSLYGVGMRERDLVYQFETDGPISAPVAKLGNSLFLASEDQTFFAVDGRNGAVLWDFASPVPLNSQPVVVGSDLFLVAGTSGMYDLSAKTGAKRWWHPGITKFVGVINDRVFVTDIDMNLSMLARKDGAILGKLQLRHFPVRIANDRTDRLFVATTSGLVVCMKPKDRISPVYHKYPDRLPLLPEFASDNPGPEDIPGAGDTGESGESSEMIEE